MTVQAFLPGDVVICVTQDDFEGRQLINILAWSADDHLVLICQDGERFRLPASRAYRTRLQERLNARGAEVDLMLGVEEDVEFTTREYDSEEEQRT